MNRYDDLFDETAPDDTIFADKSALDPLAEPETIAARESQERQLATLLQGVHENYLPTTVSIYGPPGTGKTLTTRRVCREFADRTDELAVEYVNLKECRTLFSAANEIHLTLTGEQRGAHAGLDGVFEGIWEALEAYPEWTVLILDEIDHVRHDSNYEPSEFFYRLLRGEGKLERGINLSAWLLSNELLEVDLRLDSRVRSAMSGEEVFFPPYGLDEMEAVLGPRLDRAFHEDVLIPEVRDYGIREAARRWGDARKALTLFRQAGEAAKAKELDVVSAPCIKENLKSTDKEAVTEKLLRLPENHFLVLLAACSWRDRSGDIVQPVTTSSIVEALQDDNIDYDIDLGERAVRDILSDLETIGLVDTWIDSRGKEGRVKQIQTTFEPDWVQDCLTRYLEKSKILEAGEK